RSGAATNFGIFRLFNSGGGELTLNNATITGGNTPSNVLGGAIFNGSTVTINNSTISGNEALEGGGIYNEGTMTINNSTISGNEARAADFSAYGGGIFNSGTMTINNSTISGNIVSDAGYGYGYDDQYNGGGIFNRGTLTLNRTIVSGNTAYALGDEIYARSSATTNSNNYNVIGYSGSSRSDGFTPSGTDVVPAGALNTVLNTTLADNGGPTLTHALISGSPAIDIAPAGDCSGAPVNGVDQRGVSRSQDGNVDGTAACDAGAVERIPQVCAVSISTPYNLGGVVINFDDLASTNLNCVRVEYVDGNHPNATSSMSNDALETGRYWRLSGLQADGTTPATGTFQADITLPYTGADADSRACKWLDGSGVGFGWDCGTDADNTEGTNTVTRDNYTGGFSDWAVGDNVGPTAVTNLQSQTTTTPFNWVAASLATLLMTLGTLITLGKRRG
ncbi:MAG: hypothetical protein KDD89_12555, partial [Anaerolineales bacterium]|nr:hypothetical protein [Anaerolineales bacterium]